MSSNSFSAYIVSTSKPATQTSKFPPSDFEWNAALEGYYPNTGYTEKRRGCRVKLQRQSTHNRTYICCFCPAMFLSVHLSFSALCLSAFHLSVSLPKAVIEDSITDSPLKSKYSSLYLSFPIPDLHTILKATDTKTHMYDLFACV